MRYAVTIGVCVKNGSSLILNALESVMVQDFPHSQMEVIVVDDGSIDDTLTKVAAFSKKMDMDVQVLHFDWQGISKSRNIIGQMAEGKYIIWVDSDMVLSKTFVKEQFNLMENNQKIGIAKGVYGILPDVNLVASLENMSFVSENSKYECGTGGAIYRTDALRQAGYFDASLKLAGEDHLAASRIKAAGWLLERSPAVFFEHPRTSWSRLWSKYYNWGYGVNGASRQKSNLVVLYEMLPLAGFVGGFKRSLIAYRLTGNKKNFLLPIQFIFKLSAWCLGYMKGYLQNGKKLEE